jgi:hypothetical protein
MSSATIEIVVQRLSSADSGTSFEGDWWIGLDKTLEEGDLVANFYSTDVKVKAEAAVQLRDNLEHYINGPLYPAFLKKLIPIFLNCLGGPPVFISTSPEQVCDQIPIYE